MNHQYTGSRMKQQYTGSRMAPDMLSETRSEHKRPQA